jgi:serine/threonine-protein kinase
MAEPTPPSKPVAGKYRLTRLLGKGGMGAVWEGIHESLGTRVAVKFIDTDYASSDEIRNRFVNEAKAAARLRSKHVVQVYDQGVGDDGKPYIVMEFLEGEPLDRRLDRQGRLSVAETAKIVLHVCRALAKAHEARIVHRDLKPENIFLVRDDEDETELAKVVDFGIAKFTDPSGGGSSSTRTGAVLGTPQFMSPEQARGLRTVDHRADLWSVGVIAYRCVVGVLPFKGEAVGDLLVNICTADAPVPSTVVSDVPPGFDGWVRRALARDQGGRFQSAYEIADSLAAVAGLETRMGAPSAGNRADSSDLDLARAETPDPLSATGAPLATTNIQPGRSRRSLLMLAALFFGVVLVAFVAARSFLHAGPDVAPAASGATASSAVHATDVPAKTAPEVLPVTGQDSPAPSASAETNEPEPPSKSTKGAVQQRPRPVKNPPPAKPADTTPPKPGRPKDELGY